MIKRILVPTDGSAEAAIGMRYAVHLGKRLNAGLHGLHVVDIKLLEGPFLRDVSAALGTAPYVNYQGNITMVLEERGSLALKAFREACQEAGVSCETDLDTGMVVRTILERSELADLIVLGRAGEHVDWLEGLVGSTTESVARRAGVPVLVTNTDAADIEHLVVAYDGSPHAKRALQEATDIVEDWGIRCSVLVVGDAKGDLVVEQAKKYMAPHAIEAEYVLRQGDPSETIVAYAEECGADLLAMGAYGHTKVRELVLGSTTSYAMNHAPCPLLLVR